MRRTLLLLLLAGCNQILGIDGVHQRADAGIDSPMAPPNTVVGTSVVTYIKSDGSTTMQNEDLSQYTVRALIPDGSPSGYQIVDGSGTADGAFTINGVPDNTSYLLELRPPTYPPLFYATKQHVIDAGFVTIGRPDATSTTLTTPVTMTLSGMTAWATTDSLWADSFATGTENALYFNNNPNATLTNGPTVNATSLTNMGVDWKSGYTYDFNGAPPRLVQGSAGDDLFVAHVGASITHDDQNNRITLSRLLDYFQSSSVNMTDGATATVSGAFTHAALANLQSLTLDVGQFRALAGDNNRFFAEMYQCSRLTNYAVAYDGRIGAPFWDMSGTLLPRQTMVSITNSTYGDPLAAMWSTMMSCSFSHRRRWKMPGGQAVLWISSQSSDVAATNDMVRSPPIASPTNATIGGKPYLDGGAIAFDGTAPVVIQWAPVPMVAKYLVRIRHVYVMGNVARAEVAGTFWTADTQLAIPASVLMKGEFYNFEIVAWSLPDKTAFAGGHIRRYGFPSANADLFSGMFRLSSDCGNHTVDTGEECDDGGESATCDSDCTLRSCGDGMVNATAGEACDNALNSPSCDNDCTVATCGDMLVNVARGEDCDDGNMVTGDGCSPKCTNEICGSGVVDPGEQCDDKNTVSGDGCSATCQTEAGYTCDTSVIPSVCTQ